MTNPSVPVGSLRPAILALAAGALLALAPPARAGIDGVHGTTFSLTARAGYVSLPDGASVYAWGYTTTGTMQLPGPTLIVTEGSTVSVTLTNALPGAAGNVSLVFPGHEATTTGGVSGAITREAKVGGSVTYTFVADRPGTYQYHSGTRPDLQVEMGLYGALIVEPATVPSGCSAAAYDHAATCFDREYLFLLSEIDLDIHRAAEQQATSAGPIALADEPYRSEYWLINGRAAPDTMAAAGTAELPTQPYNALPRMHPGERVLMRVVGAGRQMHPFHHHGNHSRVLAHDGHLILTEDGAGLAGPLLFTIPSVPGGTVDAIFEWTGQDLGWDLYGHTTDQDPEPGEWLPDHGKPIPVQLPDQNVLVFGGFYSGSPYLGALGSLPPGEGGLNPSAGFTYMWHSHTERELVNNDIFPGGMMTMLIIEAPSVPIP